MPCKCAPATQRLRVRVRGDAPIYQALVQYIPLERPCCSFFEFQCPRRSEWRQAVLEIDWTSQASRNSSVRSMACALRSDDEQDGSSLACCCSRPRRKSMPKEHVRRLDGGALATRRTGRALVRNVKAQGKSCSCSISRRTSCAPCRIETKSLVRAAPAIPCAGAADRRVSRWTKPRTMPKWCGLRPATRSRIRSYCAAKLSPTEYGGIRYLPQMFFVDRTGSIVQNTRGIHDQCGAGSGNPAAAADQFACSSRFFSP